MHPTHRRTLTLALIAAALLPWLGLFITHRFFDPSLALWTALVTLTAVTTDAALWVAGGWLGYRAWSRHSGLASLFGRAARTP